MRPTVEEGFDAKPWDNIVENVDFPTPPLPERTRILCLTEERRAVMMGMSGSGPLGAEAHIAWLGQPAQESAWPAVRDSGPGQCSVEMMLVFCSLAHRKYREMDVCFQRFSKPIS
jgi:hypothetical protein